MEMKIIEAEVVSMVKAIEDKNPMVPKVETEVDSMAKAIRYTLNTMGQTFRYG